MLFQVGGQGTRPTFFEMAAAQQLPASLRAALTYSLGVLAVRRPFLHKVLDYDDEFFALLMMILETHSLRTTVYEVVLTYFKSKLHSIYNREREATLQASLWGPGETRFDDVDYLDDGETSNVSSQRSTIRKKIEAIVGACYPWLRAGTEGLSFAYQLLYLLDATGFYSPGLHVLGVHVCRATGQELMDASARISKIRSNERGRLRGPPWLKAVQRVVLSCMYTSLDCKKWSYCSGMMEWWYQSAAERMSAPTAYPPPPPPPPPKVAEEGIPLPQDRTICPLCTQKRANPSVVAVSGFVFCYPCIFRYVSQVTLIPSYILTQFAHNTLLSMVFQRLFNIFVLV
ncbi:hypothetical protein C5167_044009 [Papaver somniferum]|uniref:Peroxisome biogenesis protein 12 n=1 Tax=Papaver somniferum TaxID=3469 RepID=A0A4Y7LA88_PAPSO|nr:hypothetical protein C5167_044009 [Papaver somniferum]